MQPLEIGINLVSVGACDGGVDIGPNSYLEVRDNGPGIHPKMFMEVLTSFGATSLISKNKSEHNYAEHGVGLKLNCLRLARTSLIITKTRPVLEFGMLSYYISFSLISSDFMKKADSANGFLVAPIVSLEVKNRRIQKQLTPEPDHFLNMMSTFTKHKFDSGDKIL